MKRVVILGRKGQISKALSATLSGSYELIQLGSDDIDLVQVDKVQKRLIDTKAETIINAAAYTKVDAAEDNQQTAWKINVEAVDKMAQAAAELNARFIHFSSDYVFDGMKASPYVENDPTKPINFYGITKKESEIRTTAAGCRHWIFRTSWVFSKAGSNFVKNIVRLAVEKNQLSVVDDQLGAPTSASFIAAIVASCIESENRIEDGIYHLTANGKATWHDVATYTIRRARQIGVACHANEDSILAVSSQDFHQAASRPKNSILNCDKLFSKVIKNRPSWYDLLLDEFQTKEDFL